MTGGGRGEGDGIRDDSEQYSIPTPFGTVYAQAQTDNSVYIGGSMITVDGAEYALVTWACRAPDGTWEQDLRHGFYMSPVPAISGDAPPAAVAAVRVGLFPAVTKYMTGSNSENLREALAAVRQYTND